MRNYLTLPARVNLLGSPGDANEGDFAVISAAIEMRAQAVVDAADGLVLEALDPRNPEKQGDRLRIPNPELPLPYDGRFDLIKGAINRLHRFSPEFRDKFNEQGIRIATWSDIPRQSGLGGSSLFVLLALAGLRQFYNLESQAHNDYVLAELAQRVEAKELGITCGYADRYVPLFAGLAYVDYRGKLHQREVGREPFATYERLDKWVSDLPLVVIFTGLERDSGDVHRQMRPRYLEEQAQWAAQGGEPPPMMALMEAAWETAWRGKVALLEGDLATFGALMNENHRLVDEMMVYCGFTNGAGQENNQLIKTALQNGALGAKLTGAGGGGSVVALVRPGEQDGLEQAWNQAAKKAGLRRAQVFRPHIAREGLVVVEARDKTGGSID